MLDRRRSQVVALLPHEAAGSRGRCARTPAPLSILPFALAFAAVILLIADLDRYRGGWIRVSQQPMVELLESMGPPP